MKPFVHAKLSVRKYGGKVKDYIDIHNFLDISKMSHPDMRHRAILHNSLGPFIAEKIFGIDYDKLNEYKEKFGWSEEEVSAIEDILYSSRTDSSTCLINSDGEKVSVRRVTEDHIKEDMGKIPSVSDYLNHLPMLEMLGHRRKAVKELILKREDFFESK